MTSGLVSRLGRGACAAAVPTALGACFYAFCRAQETWFVARALHAPAIGPLLRRGRLASLASCASLPRVLVDVAPDFIWAFAVGAMLRAFDPGRRANAVWAVVGAISVVGYEVAQAWHLAPGSFDWRDVVAQALGYVIGWLAARASTTTSQLRATSGWL